MTDLAPLVEDEVKRFMERWDLERPPAVRSRP